MFTSSTLLTDKLLRCVFICVLVCLLCLQIPLLYQPLAQYAQDSMQEEYGSSPILPTYEAKIAEIAKSMGISKPIIIREMNTDTLSAMGYYGIFATFHLFYSYFPLVDTPFLFVSKNFFKDLPEDEQRFLIGHELIYIKEQYTRYSKLCAVLFFIALLTFLRFFFRDKYFMPLIKKFIPARHHFLAKMLLSWCGIWICFFITLMGMSVYRKHVVWQADKSSLAHLQAYEGGIKLMDRWQRDYYMTDEYPWWDLFSDYPTCAERKNYFLEQKILNT